LATDAIEQAIRFTQQDATPPVNPNQILEVFLLMKKALVTQIDNFHQSIYQMGSPLGFNLLNDFAGLHYIFFGDFAAFRPEVVVWRLQMLREILDAKKAGAQSQFERGQITEDGMQWGEEFMKYLQIWVVVTGVEEKRKIEEVLEEAPLGYTAQIFSIADIVSELENLTKASY
jgi:hypothetical protein